jgi:hypothetical protein
VAHHKHTRVTPTHARDQTRAARHSDSHTTTRRRLLVCTQAMRAGCAHARGGTGAGVTCEGGRSSTCGEDGGGRGAAALRVDVGKAAAAPLQAHGSLRYTQRNPMAPCQKRTKTPPPPPPPPAPHILHTQRGVRSTACAVERPPCVPAAPNTAVSHVQHRCSYSSTATQTPQPRLQLNSCRAPVNASLSLECLQCWRGSLATTRSPMYIDVLSTQYNVPAGVIHPSCSPCLTKYLLHHHSEARCAAMWGRLSAWGRP